MRIAWIGGLDRNEMQLKRMAAAAGHHLDFHKGDTGGRGAAALRSTVERADLVIILTDVNSHGGVQLARRLCQRLGRGALVVRRCGASQFQRLLDALSSRDERMMAAALAG